MTWATDSQYRSRLRTRIFEAQGGKCFLCGAPLVLKRPGNVAHLDHNHETDRIRGILCGRCNAGLAPFDNDPDWALRAVDYLTEPPFDFPHCPDTLQGLVSTDLISIEPEMVVHSATVLESMK